MIPDQGEFALIIEADENGIPINLVSYTTPARGEIFAENEKRDIYLAAVMNENTLEDESKLMLDAYLTETGGSCDFVGKDLADGGQMITLRNPNSGVASTLTTFERGKPKYKPVAEVPAPAAGFR